MKDPKDKTTTDFVDLAARVQTLEAERDEAFMRGKQVFDGLEQHRKWLWEERRKNQELEAQNKALVEAIRKHESAQRVPQLERAIEELDEQHRHALLGVETQRNMAQQRVQELEQQLGTASVTRAIHVKAWRDVAQTAEAALAEAEQENNRLRADLAELEAELADMQHRIGRVVNERDLAQTELARVRELEAQNKRLTEYNSQHVSDYNTILRANGKLEQQNTALRETLVFICNDDPANGHEWQQIARRALAAQGGGE